MENLEGDIIEVCRSGRYKHVHERRAGTLAVNELWNDFETEDAVPVEGISWEDGLEPSMSSLGKEYEGN